MDNGRDGLDGISGKQAGKTGDLFRLAGQERYGLRPKV